MSALATPSKSVGPDYRPEKQKPTATVSTAVPYENVVINPNNPLVWGNADFA